MHIFDRTKPQYIMPHKDTSFVMKNLIVFEKKAYYFFPIEIDDPVEQKGAKRGKNVLHLFFLWVPQHVWENFE